MSTNDEKRAADETNIKPGDVLNNQYEVIRYLGSGLEAHVFLIQDRNEHNMQ